jgi:hypothetical protein
MNVPAALSSEALFAKSQVYMQRALARKDGGDLDEYQLWASLALELLGKSVLAALHPSLVADPQSWESLFAAAGKVVSTDVKTITAKTLFLRLGHMSPRFDKTVAGFCDAIAQRRNAELHSGEAPFRAMRLEAWQDRFWHAAEVILSMRDQNLEAWLGADQAAAPQVVLAHAAAALADAVRVRIDDARIAFGTRSSSDRKRALADLAGKTAIHFTDLFDRPGDGVWRHECPACRGQAFATGEAVSEEIVDQGADRDWAWETVERTYSPEEFHCPACELHLSGFAELEAGGLSDEHIEEEERELEYEPEYGND